MYLSYLELALLITISFSFGGFFAYLLLKQRIKTLKESLLSLDASLKGMWDNHEEWQKKYTDLEQTQQRAKSQKINQLTIAKHASDDRIGLQEYGS